MFDALYPAGLQMYWRANFVKEISDEAISEHLKFGKELPTMLSTMHIYPVNGAASKIGKGDTAWNNRDSSFSMIILGVDPDPSNKELITKWAKDYYDALQSHSEAGAYVNFMMEEGEDRIKAAYGDNYDKLVQIKKKYDPNNLFRVNQNIKP